MMQRAPAGILKMSEDTTLASMPMAEPEPEQDEEGDAMWPLKREECLVELYRNATKLYDLTAEGYQKCR